MIGQPFRKGRLFLFAEGFDDAGLGSLTRGMQGGNEG